MNDASGQRSLQPSMRARSWSEAVGTRKNWAGTAGHPRPSWGSPGARPTSITRDRREELPGNTFRITFRHINGQPTGSIELYQGEAEHFAVELEAIAAFLRAALIADRKSG